MVPQHYPATLKTQMKNIREHYLWSTSVPPKDIFDPQTLNPLSLTSPFPKSEIILLLPNCRHNDEIGCSFLLQTEYNLSNHVDKYIFSMFELIWLNKYIFL
jgi:hypothetical protein